MKQARFSQVHEARWQRFEAMLAAGAGRPAGSKWPKVQWRRKSEQARDAAIPPPDWSTFPAEYRQIVQDLAVARARGYSLGLIARLEHLALTGHQRLYTRRAPFGAACAAFIAGGFPQLVRRHWVSMLVSTILFFGTMLAAAWLVVAQPDVLLTLIPPDQVDAMEEMYDPTSSRLGRERDAGDDVAMFGFYIRNNTGIGFQTFAGGLLVGLGTLFFLVFNGLHIGAIAGHLSANGFAVPFWSFVSGHSAFELTAIVISGAAGLRLGWSLIHPGRQTRGRALVSAAKEVVGLVYGAAMLFFLAAFVEAFWSSQSAIPPTIKYAVGGALWALTIAYLVLVGRGRWRGT